MVRLTAAARFTDDDQIGLGRRISGDQFDTTVRGKE
jgi:hypothetical protein